VETRQPKGQIMEAVERAMERCSLLKAWISPSEMDTLRLVTGGQ